MSRRIAFAVVAYAFAVTMLGTTLPTPLYPLYQHKLGFSGLMVTVIFAVYAFGVIAALLLFGQASDQIGRRLALLPGLVLSALSAGAFLLVGGLGFLFAGRILSGLSAGIFTGTATATLVDFAPHERRDRATLVATMANMGGLGCGPLLAGLLAEYAALPLRLCFIVDLALLVPAMLGVLLMPEPVRERTLRLAPTRLNVPAEARGTFVRAAIAGFAGFAVLGLFTAVAPSFLDQILHLPSHATVGVVVWGVFAASTVGQLALGRVGERRALLVGCLTLAAGMVVLASGLAAGSLALLVSGGVVAGLGQGLSFRAGLAAVNAEAPAERRAEVASSFFVVAYVAISLPVIGVGVAAEAFSLRSAGIAFSAIVAALAVIAFALLVRRSPERAEHSSALSGDQSSLLDRPYST